MTRIPNRTAHIKPATREAVLDQLAAIADGIIADRTRLDWMSRSMTAAAVRIHALESRRPWHLAWWRA